MSLVRLADVSGIKLEQRGADEVGCYTFHEDKTPSLVIMPTKNLYRCFGCRATGGSID